MPSLSEGSSGIIEESETSRRSNMNRSARGEKMRRKFHRCMESFLVEGGPCCYVDKSIDNIEVPLRYKHLAK